MANYLNEYRVKLGIAQNPLILKFSETFVEQVQVLMEEKIPVFSFTFGLPPQEVIQAMKQRGTVVRGLVASLTLGATESPGGRRLNHYAFRNYITWCYNTAPFRN